MNKSRPISQILTHITGIWKSNLSIKAELKTYYHLMSQNLFKIEKDQQLLFLVPIEVQDFEPRRALYERLSLKIRSTS